MAGPTCSGKSGLAMALADRFGGTIVNADSMQVYRELRVLTARPTEADEAAHPHTLYGVRPAAEPADVAWWRAAALDAMAATDGLPILCGGTGLYLESLTRGLSTLPPISADARDAARYGVEAEGPAASHARLSRVDPATAATLRPSDPQRIARAWEVLLATGRGLKSWQDEPRPVADWRFAAILLDPPRDALRTAIDLRLDAMLGQGALAEVRALLDRSLDPALPAMRAHGVTEFAAHLRGMATLAEAARRTALVTGQYTKRQATWFRNRPPVVDPEALHTIHARFAGLTQLPELEWTKILRFTQNAVDGRG